MKSSQAHLIILSCILIMTNSLEALRRRHKKTEREKMKTAFILQSSAFAHDGDIPEEYTCDGQDMSPPLRWSLPPKETKSFALLCEDPDAIGGKIWVHWLMFNIPVTVHNLIAGEQASAMGAIEGLNSWQNKKYGGPCPPLKKHHYIFTLYALDVPKLSLTSNADRSALLDAMKGHIVAKAVLVGRYQRVKDRE
jgi:Raf kinase inhibitor-like YbhB/YbcL family protein